MKTLAITAFVFLGIIWGTNFIFMKWGTELISPQQLVFVRILSGLVPILIYSLIKKEIKLIHLKYFHHFIFMAIMSTVIYYYSFAKASTTLPSGIAGAASGAIPLFAYIVSLIFIKEEILNMRKFLAIILGFAGVLILSNPFHNLPNSSDMVAFYFIIGGSLCAGSAFAYTKRYITPLNIPPSALVSYQLIISLIILVFIIDFNGIDNLLLDTKSFIGVLIGLGILGTGLAYITYYYIIEKLGPVTASSATYIPPLVALIVGVIFENENIYLADFFATGLILLGVLLLNKKKVYTGQTPK